MSKKIVWTNEQLDKARILYEQGKSLNFIGKQFGCSHVTVSRIFKENNIPVREPKGKFLYYPGERIGPRKILFLERCEKDSYGQYKGIFECPYCKKPFKSRIDKILSDRDHSCGCNTSYAKGASGRKYSPGEKIGPCKTELLERISNGDNPKGIFKCSFCGKNFETFISSVVVGFTYSCGCQKASRGEIKIQQILTELQINFETQKTFSDCRNLITGYLLKFDFYLPSYNICIEYDGEQHFQEINFFEQNSSTSVKYRDDLKTAYCKENNIKLIRIPYYDFNKINEKYLKERISYA